MTVGRVFTKNDERLVEKEIVDLLLKKDVSYAQAKRILKNADKRIKNIPISDSMGKNQ